jgi:hypothetical protein
MNLRINKDDNILFLKEESKYIYNIPKGTFKEFKPEKHIKSCIISDSMVDIKCIEIPVVSSRLLKSIVINTIKKHSTIVPSEENIDYLILKEEDRKYEIMVFIKLYNDDEDLLKRNIFTSYHVITNLLKDRNIPDDVSFLTNIDKTWFLYTFKDRIFKRRDIYFKEDLKNLKNEQVYFLDIYSTEKEHVNKTFKKDFKFINKEAIDRSFYTLKNSIFRKNTALEPKKLYSFISAGILLAILITLELVSLSLGLKKNDLINELTGQNRIFEEERSKRGISDILYKQYIELLSKKSNVNELFKNLYLSAKNNIEIDRLSIDKNSFTITGSCLDDSKLEENFRKSEFWRKVNFTFSKKKGKIYFRITGEIIND